MSTTWPGVVGWLVTALPNLPGWSAVTVFDGPPVTAGPPSDYVTVGFVDNEQAGSYTQTADADGFSVDETGTVRCRLVCTTSQVDMPGTRVRLFALVDAVAASVRTDRRLGGVLSAQGTVDLVVNVESIVNPTGTATSCVFDLNYYTVT